METGMHTSENAVLVPPAIGHIDYAQDGHVYGWAFNPRNPGDKVIVEIISNGKVVASGKADVYREDLDSLDIGDGNHGFRLKLSYELLDGNTYELSAKEKNTQIALNGGPILFGPETRIRSFYTIPREHALELFSLTLQGKQGIDPAKTKALLQAFEIGALAQETERFEDATYAWSTLNNYMHQSALCLSKMAEINLLMKNNHQALSYYKRATEVDFSFHWAHLGMAGILTSSGDFINANRAVEIAAALNPACKITEHITKHLREKLLASEVDGLVSSGKTYEAVQLLRNALAADNGNNTAKLLLENIAPKSSEPSRFQYGHQELLSFQDNLEEFEIFLNKMEANIVGTA